MSRSSEHYFIWPPFLHKTFRPNETVSPGVHGPSDFRVNSLGLRGRAHGRLQVTVSWWWHTKARYRSWPSLERIGHRSGMPNGSRRSGHEVQCRMGRVSKKKQPEHAYAEPTRNFHHAREQSRDDEMATL
jgi:hypothetical protein